MARRKQEPQYEVRDSYEQPLACKLTEDELFKRGEEAGSLKEQLDLAKAIEKDRAKEAKDRIDAIEADLARVLKELRTKTEIRKVDVEERLIVEENAVVKVRTDTSEELTRRAATGADLQRDLLDGAGEPTDPEDDDQE